MLERGRAVRDRIRDVRAFDAGGPLDPESNYLFGEGGAGTFSDGKLTCRGTGPDVRRVLELFAECKGKPSILYDARPHLGSNRLPAVVKAIRRRIEALGGEVRFSCRVEDLDLADGRLRGLATSSGYVPASVAVLAIGHSARDTYEMLLRRGVPMVQKPFQMGVRIEHPQETVNRVQYGPTPLEERLGAADYSLVANGRHDLFTFCMCAGGYIMPSVSEPGYFCTNGMSLSKHDSPFANSGLVVTVAAGGVRRRRRAGRRAPAAGLRAAGLRGRPAASTSVRSSGRATSSPAGRRTACRPTATRAARSPARSPNWCRRWSSRRCGTACRSWTAAGTAASCRRRRWSARRRAAAPRCASSATTTTRRDAGHRRAVPGRRRGGLRRRHRQRRGGRPAHRPGRGGHLRASPLIPA